MLQCGAMPAAGIAASCCSYLVIPARHVACCGLKVPWSALTARMHGPQPVLAKLRECVVLLTGVLHTDGQYGPHCLQQQDRVGLFGL